jgi:hypothetical protein
LTTITDKANVTQKIDDKLDFKNKSRRHNDNEKIDTRHNDRPEKIYNFDYEDEEETVQNVQSVVINNLPQKRPYNRPILTVTENVNKYTYLINYVPRPTESYRPTTRRHHDNNRDVIKVTYQNYDDTYRRPNNPYYYNKRDHTENNRPDDFYRNKRPTQTTHKENLQSSARSNDDVIPTVNTKTLTDKNTDKSTTENFYKLVTFGYVGTYKGDSTTENNVTPKYITEKEDKTSDVISKDFSTYDAKHTDIITDQQMDNMKLSTFFLYETATKPYSNSYRPIRRHDDKSKGDKYYYIKNVLHKYSDSSPTADKPAEEKKDILKENYNNPGIPHSIQAEERSSLNKIAALEEVESKAASLGRKRDKIKKPPTEAKTPSVAFQIIPSESR